MVNRYYLKVLFESTADYKKIILLLFIFQNDKEFLREIGFSERDINRLNLEFKSLLKEHHEKCLDYVRNEAESVIERTLNI